MARKVFRFGKFLSGYIGAYHFVNKCLRIWRFEPTLMDEKVESEKLSEKLLEREEKVTLVDVLNEMQRFIMANFFFFDTFNWCAKLGLLFSDDGGNSNAAGDDTSNRFKFHTIFRNLFNNRLARDYSQYGTYLWFVAMLFILTIDLLKMIESVKRESSVLDEMNRRVKARTLMDMERVRRMHHNVDNNTNNSNSSDAVVMKGSGSDSKNAKMVTFEGNVLGGANSENVDVDDSEKKLKEEKERIKLLKGQLDKIYGDRDKHFVAIARNVCDFGIASNLVGIWDISAGQNAFLGLVSALIGSYELWPAK